MGVDQKCEQVAMSWKLSLLQPDRHQMTGLRLVMFSDLRRTMVFLEVQPCEGDVEVGRKNQTGVSLSVRDS